MASVLVFLFQHRATNLTSVAWPSGRPSAEPSGARPSGRPSRAPAERNAAVPSAAFVAQGNRRNISSLSNPEEHVVQGSVGGAVAPSPNRTIVVVLGSLRGGEEAWASLEKNVLDPSGADLALLVPQPDGSAARSSLHARARYLWHYRDYDDWGEAVDLIPTHPPGNLTPWRTLAEREAALIRLRGHPMRNPSIFGGVRGHGASGAVIFMLRWFLQEQIRRHGLTSQYDRFVVTRSDHYYECTHNASAFPVHGKQLFVPEGQWYRGRTDRHLVVGNHNVLNALDVYPTFFATEWIQNYSEGGIMNTEILLHRVWREKGLAPQPFPRVMFTVARASDSTRWRRATVPVPHKENLFIKYPTDSGGGPGEYTLAQRTCHPDKVVELPKRKKIATVRLA